jgi:ABC-type Fe3+/spermidine/putrescine transport system ATPase subunit
MLKLKSINKSFGQFALRDINMDIREGEYYVLLGRSGSGKTRLLELITGLTDPDSGEIWLNGENITGKKIQKRGIGLVFQDYALFPNMSVAGNIAYPLNSSGTDKRTVAAMLDSISGKMNIGHLLNRYIHNLSGGELQRVALARTLVTSPKLLLLDEPMASIDASLKDDIKRLLRNLNKGGLTIIHVTHDYREAVSLAARVGVMHNGQIIQEGNTDEVFRKPVNRFVARYAGIKNFFRTSFIRENGSWKAHCGNGIVLNIPENDYPAGGLMILRNEDIKISAARPQGNHENLLRGKVVEITPSENGMEIVVEAGQPFYIEVSREFFSRCCLQEQSEVWMSFSAAALVTLKGSN